METPALVSLPGTWPGNAGAAEGSSSMLVIDVLPAAGQGFTQGAGASARASGAIRKLSLSQLLPPLPPGSKQKGAITRGAGNGAGQLTHSTAPALQVADASHAVGCLEAAAEEDCHHHHHHQQQQQQQQRLQHQAQQQEAAVGGGGDQTALMIGSRHARDDKEGTNQEKAEVEEVVAEGLLGGFASADGRASAAPGRAGVSQQQQQQQEKKKKTGKKGRQCSSKASLALVQANAGGKCCACGEGAGVQEGEEEKEEAEEADADEEEGEHEEGEEEKKEGEEEHEEPASEQLEVGACPPQVQGGAGGRRAAVPPAEQQQPQQQQQRRRRSSRVSSLAERNEPRVSSLAERSSTRLSTLAERSGHDEQAGPFQEGVPCKRCRAPAQGGGHTDAGKGKEEGKGGRRCRRGKEDEEEEEEQQQVSDDIAEGEQQQGHEQKAATAAAGGHGGAVANGRGAGRATSKRQQQQQQHVNATAGQEPKGKNGKMFLGVHKGVGASRHAWRVEISDGKRRTYLGTWLDDVEAARWYDRAALKVRGEHRASLNFPPRAYDQDQFMKEYGNLGAAEFLELIRLRNREERGVAAGNVGRWGMPKRRASAAANADTSPAKRQNTARGNKGLRAAAATATAKTGANRSGRPPWQGDDVSDGEHDDVSDGDEGDNGEEGGAAVDADAATTAAAVSGPGPAPPPPVAPALFEPLPTSRQLAVRERKQQAQQQQQHGGGARGSGGGGAADGSDTETDAASISAWRLVREAFRRPTSECSDEECMDGLHSLTNLFERCPVAQRQLLAVTAAYDHCPTQGPLCGRKGYRQLKSAMDNFGRKEFFGFAKLWVTTRADHLARMPLGSDPELLPHTPNMVLPPPPSSVAATPGPAAGKTLNNPKP